MLSVGITGGIASGKSTVCRYLENKGAAVVDADKIAHRVMESDPDLKEALREEFGIVVVPDGGVDRRRLADIVFNDPDRLNRLNRLTHPPVVGEISRIMRGWREKPPAEIVVVQAPLLIEAGMAEMFDVIVVMVSRPEQQVDRLVAAGLSREAAVRRVRAQAPDWTRLPEADLTLINKGNLKLLEEQAQLLYDRLKAW